MPGCNKNAKKRSKSCNRNGATSQRVVIPKGTVNPNETTIIEIPCRLQSQAVVVAQRKGIAESSGEYPDMEEESFYSICNQQEGQYLPSTKENTTIMEVHAPCPKEVHAPCAKENTGVNLAESESSKNTAAPLGDQCGLTLPCIPQSRSNMVELETNHQLDETEELERMQLQKDLEAFQLARRRLLETTTKLTNQLCSDNANQTDCSTNITSCRSPCSTSSHRDNTMIDPTFDHEEYSKQLYSMLQ